MLCGRRSMVRKSSSVGSAFGRGASCGSRQCIRSESVRPSASASGSSVLMSGRPTPRSQRLTALSVTCSCAARSACVSPQALRVRARKAPKSLAFIRFTSFEDRIAYPAPKRNRRFVYPRWNAKTPAVCSVNEHAAGALFRRKSSMRAMRVTKGVFFFMDLPKQCKDSCSTCADKERREIVIILFV